jgi:hypothetical protein
MKELLNSFFISQGLSRKIESIVYAWWYGNPALFTDLLHIVFTKCSQKIIGRKVKRNFKTKNIKFQHALHSSVDVEKLSVNSM